MKDTVTTGSVIVHSQDGETFDAGFLAGFNHGTTFARLEISQLKDKIAEYEKAVEPLIPHTVAYVDDSDTLIVIPPSWLSMNNAVTLGHLRRLVGLRRRDD